MINQSIKDFIVLLLTRYEHVNLSMCLVDISCNFESGLCGWQNMARLSHSAGIWSADRVWRVENQAMGGFGPNWDHSSTDGSRWMIALYSLCYLLFVILYLFLKFFKPKKSPLLNGFPYAIMCVCMFVYCKNNGCQTTTRLQNHACVYMHNVIIKQISNKNLIFNKVK